MMASKLMDHNDDVEHLFSWLQTPELRYREFAGVREIVDTVVTWPPRPNTAEAETFPEQTLAPTVEPRTLEPPTVEHPGAPAASFEPDVVHGPEMIAPTIMPAAESVSPSDPNGPFALGAGGRGVLHRTETVAPNAPPQPMSAPPVTQIPVPPSPQPHPEPDPAAGDGLLGGAYRDSGENIPVSDRPPTSIEPSDQRSLDAVFSRLAGTRERLPDPRDRLRHIPGLGPPAGRPR
jgi:hypothetical protein